MESNRTVSENVSLDLNDSSLWRTRVRESNASEENDSGVSADSQPIVEAQQQPISPIIQKPRFEETDNSELVEVFSASKDKRSLSQTVEKNEARRKTINPLTQHIVPLTPRRQATILNPSKLPNASRVSVFNPVPNPEPIESQQIASQVPLIRPPFRLLNDDDFTIGSPVQAPTSNHKSPLAEVASCVPNDSHFNENSIVAIDLDKTTHEETFGQSFVDGGSDSDSDVALPAPKHIILRKPAKKAEKYLRARKPKILIGADETRAQHPKLRRSSRTRLRRPCSYGLCERPIYARDSQGNFCLIGVQEGRTANPLCKKWGTFDKEKAIEMDKAARKRRRVAKEVNREKWQRDFHNH
ncbi:hypothetical protein M3Y95_00829700 [Aphelenchoides besseyi]|nr:hypothetical protein M3Y95_00829700 [Aphelenchoides besseyi]